MGKEHRHDAKHADVEPGEHAQTPLPEVEHDLAASQRLVERQLRELQHLETPPQMAERFATNVIEFSSSDELATDDVIAAATARSLAPRAVVNDARRWGHDPSGKLTPAALGDQSVRARLRHLASYAAPPTPGVGGITHTVPPAMVKSLVDAVVDAYVRDLQRDVPMFRTTLTIQFQSNFDAVFTRWSTANRSAKVYRQAAHDEFFRWAFDDEGQLTAAARAMPGLPQEYARLPGPVGHTNAPAALESLLFAFLDYRAADPRAVDSDAAAGFAQPDAGRERNLPFSAVTGADAGRRSSLMAQVVARSPARPLSSQEFDYAYAIFGDSLDYGAIRIGIWNLGAKALGNTIMLNGDDDFVNPDALALGEGNLDDSRDTRQENPVRTRTGRQILIHEMTHVWQFQHGGAAYAANAINAQRVEGRSGDPDHEGKADGQGSAYDYSERLKYLETGGEWAQRQHAWERWNPEEQAQLVEDYNAALREVERAQDEGYPPAQVHTDTVARLRPFVDKVRRGEGAPSELDYGILRRDPDHVSDVSAPPGGWSPRYYQ